MVITPTRTASRAFVHWGLHSGRSHLGRSNVGIHGQAAADGSFFNKTSSEELSDKTGSGNASLRRDPNDLTENGNTEPEKVPDSQWYPGIVGYAITNVGFIKMFEFSVDVTDVRLTLAVLAAYYAAAYLLRLILRRFFKVDDKFPQFFWEGFPQRYRK